MTYLTCYVSFLVAAVDTLSMSILCIKKKTRSSKVRYTKNREDAYENKYIINNNVPHYLKGCLSNL